MPCPAVITGDAFLTRVLTHIDCQAQTLGSFGYQALGQPGSPAMLAITGLLTLFIALFGIRLLFGPAPGGRDVVVGVLKIGIVLTLAFSWPAFRTLAYDVVFTGPAEIVASITPTTLPNTGAGFTARLQAVDNGIVELTRVGTGRQTGELLQTDQQSGGFQGVAAEDESALGSARLIWLSSVIGTLASLRLIAGLLLAIAPIAAILLLFEATRGLFAGWLRGLVLAAIGTVGATIILAAELAILEPWLADALRVRSLGYAAPSAPTEILAIVLSFAIAGLVMLFVLTKVAFTRGWVSERIARIEWPEGLQQTSLLSPAQANAVIDQPMSRAQRIADHVESAMLREEGVSTRRITSVHNRTDSQSGPTGNSGVSSTAAQSRGLASPSRRTATRSSTSAARRELTA